MSTLALEFLLIYAMLVYTALTIPGLIVLAILIFRRK